MRLLNSITPVRRLELRSYHHALTAHLFEQAGRGRAEDVLKTWRDERASLLLRAAVAPTGRGDFPVHRIVDIYRSLAPTSAAMALFERGLQLDLSGLDQLYLPNVTNPANAPAIFVGEGAPARVTQMVFNKVTLGPACKTLVIAAVSAELESATPQTASALIARVGSDPGGRAPDSCNWLALTLRLRAKADMLFRLISSSTLNCSARCQPHAGV